MCGREAGAPVVGKYWYGIMNTGATGGVGHGKHITGDPVGATSCATASCFAAILRIAISM